MILLDSDVMIDLLRQYPPAGVASCLHSLPPYFKHEFSLIQWIGPSAACRM